MDLLDFHITYKNAFAAHLNNLDFSWF